MTRSEHEPCATTLTAYADHGALGVYSGSAASAAGPDHGPWHVTLRHGYPTPDAPLDRESDPVAHTRTVASRRHAEWLLDSWADARIAPDPIEGRIDARRGDA